MKSTLSILVAAWLAYSCLPKPNYPLVPEIGFVSLKRIPAGAGNDSVLLTISFKDGDGDLGLGQQDTEFPFSFYRPDGVTPNPFYYNIFIDVYRRKTLDGAIDTIVFPDGATFNGRFPKINELETPTPLRGEITYVMSFLYGLGVNPLFKKGDEIFFDVKIADRATHLSNTVQSSSVVLGGGR